MISSDFVERLGNYNPNDEELRWFNVDNVEEMTAFFNSRIPSIRSAARELGYAIGLHGSMKRDLDLIAVPWVEKHAHRDILAHFVQKAACGFSAKTYEWTIKPCGRMATSFPILWRTWRQSTPGLGHLDLSVMPAMGVY